MIKQPKSARSFPYVSTKNDTMPLKCQTHHIQTVVRY